MTARVAVLADSSLQRHILQRTLSRQGYQVVFNSGPEHMQLEDIAGYQADIWLVNLKGDDVTSPVLDFLYNTQAPVLFGEAQAPEQHSEDYPRWERTLLTKLEQLLCIKPTAVEADARKLVKQPAGERLLLPEALSRLQTARCQPAREVWLLAASLGGPDAVKQFLDALPGGLPVGFIYAQHIDAGFEQQLPQAVGRHSEWQVSLAKNGQPVHAGEVVVVPVLHELSFSATGHLCVQPTPWSGPYSPSIEQVLLNLIQGYARRSGIIVFSGMGSDGSRACESASEQGIPVWTQSASSCACPSMPDSVRKTGHSSFSATPRGLALAMLNHLLQRYTTNCVGAH